MKKHIYYIIFIILFSSFIIFSLQFLTAKRHQNGFDRNFKTLDLTIGDAIFLPSRTFAFINNTTNINLYDLSNPFSLFNVKYPSKILKEVSTRIPKTANKKYINIGILDSSLYVRNDKLGLISINTLQTNKWEDFKLGIANADQINPISKKSVILREVIIKDNSPRRKLTKINLLDSSVIIKRIPLEKQIDEYFGNDGLLKYYSKESKLIYAYFYKGEFLCLDTNLNILYNSKTIDTVRFAKIELAKSSRKNDYGIKRKITQSKPPNIINRNFTFFNNLIFIMSNLKADNENYSDFRNNQVIDVYELNNGKYKYSFYIPKYKGHKIRDIKIANNSLIGIYENYLVTFHLSGSYMY